MIKRVFLVVALVSLFSPLCMATTTTVVFDNLNGAPLTNGAPNDRTSGSFPTEFAGETVDDVTFNTTTVVTGINWTGVYGGFGDGVVAAADDDFEIRIYADNAGTPGGLLANFAVGNAVNRTLGTTQLFTGNITQNFNFSADIDFTFDANVTHWLSVLNNTAGESDDFFQSTATGGNTFAQFLNMPDAEFLDQAQNGAVGFGTNFQLTFTAVPEPSSAGILALGLMGLLTRRKRS